MAEKKERQQTLDWFDTIASEQEHLVFCLHNVDSAEDQTRPGILALAYLQGSPFVRYRSTGAMDKNKQKVAGL